MRVSQLIALLFLSPMLALANVRWHKFGVSGSDTNTITIGRVSVSIAKREIREAVFREDNLVMTVRVPGQKASECWLGSTYGYGEVTVAGDFLLLKYGVGRGTLARVEHIKVLRLHDGLKELADVQSSYYILTDIHNAEPDLFEYQLKVQTQGGWTTFTFSLPKPQRGIPSEKIVKVRNDG